MKTNSKKPSTIKKSLIESIVKDVVYDEMPHIMFINEGILGGLFNKIKMAGAGIGGGVKAVGAGAGGVVKSMTVGVINKVTDTAKKASQAISAAKDNIWKAYTAGMEEAKKRQAEELRLKMSTAIQTAVAKVYKDYIDVAGDLSPEEVQLIFSAAVLQATQYSN